MDLTSLLPSFGNGIWAILFYIIALSVIVAIHEYGHYIVGRWSGIHAEVFSLGFGRVIWSRTDKRGTKWQLAAIPLGGFVRFKGDANAASGPDGELISSLPPEELRKTMHGAPLWARSATVAAGPIFNFILSFFIFAGVILSQGVVGDKLVVGDLRDLPKSEYQLTKGDEIVAIEGMTWPDGTDSSYSEAFLEALPRGAYLDYTVLRDGDEIVVTGPYLYPPLVLELAPGGSAMDIGMASGDVITAIDGTEIFAFRDLKDAVESSDGSALKLDVWRDGQMLEFALVPRRVDEPLASGGFQTQWRIGIAGGVAFDPARETPSLGQATSIAVTQTWRIIEGSVSGLYHMITGAISSCNLSGPIGIAQTSGAVASQGVDNFIWFIGVLSAAIGLLNLFPIPVLDGGHLVFHAYEAVRGKPPSERVVRAMMSLGIAIILTLLLIGTTSDLFCP